MLTISDGGRAKAGLPVDYHEGDCAVRAMCNVTGQHGEFAAIRAACMGINAGLAQRDVPPAMAAGAGLLSLARGTITDCAGYLALAAERGFKRYQYIDPWQGGDVYPIVDWLRDHPKGRWMVQMQDHMTARVDGVWVDSFHPMELRSARWGVYAAWEYRT